MPSKQEELEGRMMALQLRLTAFEEDLGSEEHMPGGVETILHGITELLQSVDTETQNEHQQTRLDLLLQGIHGILDYLRPEEEEPQEDPDREDVTPAVPQGLEQFIDGFRREAQKRLTGLSISMMGLFNTQADDRAIDTSAQHLHAIRGGASMLNLVQVSQIAELMERLLLTMRRVPASDRTWPTQSLMRGFQLLEKAVNDPQVKLEKQEASEMLEELRQCFDEVSDEASDGFAPPQQPSTPKAAVFSRTAAKTRPINVQLEQRILIVDDMETVAASVGFVLSELDVPIDIANNGELALRMLNKRPYSLVISDIAMPRMDGIALTAIMRQTERLNNIPVILLTSLDHPSERDAGIDAGANDYIIKGSIGGGELVHRVQELLKIAPFVPIEQQKPRTEKQRVLVAEDAETVAASIAFVLSEGNLDIVLASDGMEALGRLEREDFDILISDWQMPSMSGIELIKAVRASTIIKQLPIVLLTSLSSEEFKQEAKAAGANAYLVKGAVGGGLLLKVVSQLLDEFSAT